MYNDIVDGRTGIQYLDITPQHSYPSQLFLIISNPFDSPTTNQQPTPTSLANKQYFDSIPSHSKMSFESIDLSGPGLYEQNLSTAPVFEPVNYESTIIPTEPCESNSDSPRFSSHHSTPPPPSFQQAEMVIAEEYALSNLFIDPPRIIAKRLHRKRIADELYFPFSQDERDDVIEEKEEYEFVDFEDLFADPPSMVASQMRRGFGDPFFESVCESGLKGDNEGDVSPRTMLFPRGESDHDFVDFVEDIQPGAEVVSDGSDEVVSYSSSQEEELASMYQMLLHPNSWDVYDEEEFMSESSDPDYPMSGYLSLPNSLDLEHNPILSETDILDIYICTEMDIEALVDDFQNPS